MEFPAPGPFGTQGTNDNNVGSTLQDIAQSLAHRERRAEEETTDKRGTYGGIGGDDEHLALYTLRAFDEFEVDVCTTEVGKNWIKATKKKCDNGPEFFLQLG